MNAGLNNEYEILNAINGKTLEEISLHFRGPITAMFKYHTKGEKIKVRKVTNWIHCKTDLEIHMYGIYKNVSVKMGFGPAVHQEEFESFFMFLQSLNISDETLETIKFYHYADETLDGSGIKTLSLEQFKEKYEERIKRANKELSKEDIVKAIVYRCVIKGRNERNQEINYIYHGDKSEGIFVNRDDVYDNAHKLDCYYDRAIHFGPLAYVQKIQNKKVRDGKVIQYTQIVWPNIREGIEQILKISSGECEPSKEMVTEKEPIKDVQPIEVIKQPIQPKATKTGPINSKLKENLLVMFVCIVFLVILLLILF